MSHSVATLLLNIAGLANNTHFCTIIVGLPILGLLIVGLLMLTCDHRVSMGIGPFTFKHEYDLYGMNRTMEG